MIIIYIIISTNINVSAKKKYLFISSALFYVTAWKYLVKHAFCGSCKHDQRLVN